MSLYKRKSPARSQWARKLKEGKVTEWNQNRHDAPKWRPDLRDFNFKDADMPGVNLRKAILKNANLSRCNLTGADLRGAVLTFTNLKGAVLTRADLRGAKNLTKQQLESVLDASEAKYDTERFVEPVVPGAVPAVFLSYAWEDKRAVLAVDQWLRDKGARVFIDDRNFSVGENIRDEILLWIQRAGVVVCFISANSKDRHYPKLEREIAETLRASGAKVIYFNLDDTVIDILHKVRLFVNGHKQTFDEACSTLWQGIVRSVKAPKAIDLSDIRSAGSDWIVTSPQEPETRA